MNTDFLLLDRTISRIKESLRVLEDISRWSLDHEYSAQQLSLIRHTMLSLEHRIGVASLIGARSSVVWENHTITTQTDISTVHGQTLWSRIRDNAARVTESFRVIEEFVRIHHASVAKDVEQLRYKLYGLERIMLEQTPHYFLYAYAEQGQVLPAARDVEEVFWFIEHGAKMVALKDLDSSLHLVYAKAKQICHYLKEQRLSLGNTEPVLFFIYQHVDLAIKLPINGILFEQSVSYPIQQARWKLGSNKIIGYHAHGIEALSSVVDSGADMVSYGPLFSEDENADALGLDRLSDIVERIELPFFVHGGVKLEHKNALTEHGVHNIIVDHGAKTFFS